MSDPLIILYWLLADDILVILNYGTIVKYKIECVYESPVIRITIKTWRRVKQFYIKSVTKILLKNNFQSYIINKLAVCHLREFLIGKNGI